MSERLIRENGINYIEDEWGNRRSPSFGVDVTEDIVHLMPAATQITSFGMGKLANVMQAVARKVLTDEEYADLEEVQANVQRKHDNSMLGGILPQSVKGIKDSNSRGNLAILAMGKHVVQKAADGVGKLANKDK